MIPPILALKCLVEHNIQLLSFPKVVPAVVSWLKVSLYICLYIKILIYIYLYYLDNNIMIPPILALKCLVEHNIQLLSFPKVVPAVVSWLKVGLYIYIYI